ncbi:MAG: thiamine-phosphate kinase, partial [Pseudomonadales bacterium]|nr:thiamine-phosphate kinase [Pseudomonadales bacterium]
MTKEFELIRRYFAESQHQFQRSEVVLGIGDDGAILDISSPHQLCISTDTLIAGVHFPVDAPPACIAKKALAVNLSDLAAMGASPLAFTLGLVLDEVDEQWVSEFSEGLLTFAAQFNCPLVGGDTTRGPLGVSIQIQGLVDRDSVIRRQGAEPGDRIYVSGNLGDAALALLALGHPSHLGEDVRLQQDKLTPEYLTHFETAYYQPAPRIALGQACASLVSSGLDISDGLAGDLGHILQASSVGATLNVDALPYSDPANSCASKQVRQIAALFGGDDYELCITVPSQNADAIESIAK